MAAPLPEAESLIASLAQALRGAVTPETGLVGIYSGGVWVAQRLHQALGLTLPVGQLAITLHRDDFDRIGLHREQRRSHLPFPVEGRDILLVDDVLHTGRTIRAALNELWDFGRPKSVRLVALVDRGGRELPIAADFTGARVSVGESESLVLSEENGRLRLAAVKASA